MNKPVEVNELIEGKVIDISFEGKAVLKSDNFTIFTDKGVVGDRIEVIIEKVKKNFAIARTNSILEYSAHRIESKCEYSSLCGGCDFQELDYEEELMIKEEKVRGDLDRLGKIKDYEFLPIIASENTERYRNNVQLPIMKSRGKAIIGHFQSASHKIINTNTCILQKEIADEIVQVLRDFIEEEDIPCYNRKNHKGLLRHLVIRTSEKNGDTMVILVINGKTLPAIEKLVEKFKEIKEIKSFYLNINKDKTNLVTGAKYKLIYGEDQILDKIGGYKYKISPESFFQINTRQGEKLYNKLVEFADLKGDETVVDLYSGIGSISLYLAKYARKVIGVEIVEKAVMDAIENARLNKVENVEFFQGDAGEILPKLEEMEVKIDSLIVDPPRKGLEASLLEDIVKYGPEKIVYVSCNPTTLARDLNYLEANGYKVKKVQPVDMFSRTNHVECIALIQREIM